MADASSQELQKVGIEAARSAGRVLIKQRREKKQKEAEEAQKQITAQPQPTPGYDPMIDSINEESSLEDYGTAMESAGQNISRLERLKAKAHEAIRLYQEGKFYVALGLALFLDLFDLILEGTGIGIILFFVLWIFKIAFILLIFFFLMGKGHTRIKLKIIIFAFGEMIPLLAVLPLWTFAVLWSWIKIAAKKDDALVALKVIDTALESVYKSAKFKRLS